MRPSLKIAGAAIMVLMIGAGAFYVWDTKTSIKVYVDNSLGESVQVDLPG